MIELEDETIFVATVPEILEAVANTFCDKYCKYPDLFDEEEEGCELSESDICANCPITHLVGGH